MRTARCALLAFAVGFIAGTAPLLIMHYLPLALAPNAPTTAPPALAILITGVVVGLITSVMFSESVGQKPLSDIFLYALGIPAVLLATIGNIGNELDKSQVQHHANEVLISTPAVDSLSSVEPVDVESLSKQVSGHASLNAPWWRLGVADAMAQTPPPPPQHLAAAKGEYLVVIQRCKTPREAVAAYRHFQNANLRTAAYVPMQLELLRAGGEFLVVYRRTPSKDEAVKTFKLLRINDPKLHVELVHV